MATANQKINLKYISDLIKEFLDDENREAIYNEFSFQHELGIYFRNKIHKINKDYKVEYERNISYFGIKNKYKKEIDIVIYQESKGLIIDDERFVIELKYHPKKSGTSNRMFNSLIDIKFIEELTKNNFKGISCVISEDDNFYIKKRMSNRTNVYKYFRDKKKIHGKVKYETNDEKVVRKNNSFIIKGKYTVKWKNLKNSTNENKESKRKYYVIEINKKI